MKELKIGRLKVRGILSLLASIWLVYYDWKIGVPLLLIAYGRKRRK